MISVEDFEELQSKLTANTSAKTKYRNAYSKWVEEDGLRLLDWYNNGRKMNLLCQELGRTEKAIEARITKLRLDQFQQNFTDFIEDIAAEFSISFRLFKTKVDAILDRKRYLFLKSKIKGHFNHFQLGI